MYNEDELCSIREAEAECEETKVSPTRERFGERKDQFSSDTDGIDVDRLYTPADIATHSYKEDSGFPGQEPYGVFIDASRSDVDDATMRWNGNSCRDS